MYTALRYRTVHIHETRERVLLAILYGLWREVVLSEVLETGERETRDRGPARHRRLRAKAYVQGRDSKVRKKKKQALAPSWSQLSSHKTSFRILR